MGKAEEHNNTSRTEAFQFTAAPPLQIFGLSLCLCGNSLAEERCPCAKEPSQPPSPMVDLCVLEIETDSTKMLSYYKSSLQLMEYSPFHFIINSLSVLLQLNPTWFWKPSPTAKGPHCAKGKEEEKPTEIFYPLERGKIKDLVALKQVIKFPATPNPA